MAKDMSFYTDDLIPEIKKENNLSDEIKIKLL